MSIPSWSAPGVTLEVHDGRQAESRQTELVVLHDEVVGDELKPAERDHRVGLDPAGDPDGGLGGQRVERRLERAAVPAVGDLDGAGVVADDHELHRALQAQYLHPARDGDGLAYLAAQAGDGCADHR